MQLLQTTKYSCCHGNDARPCPFRLCSKLWAIFAKFRLSHHYYLPSPPIFDSALILQVTCKFTNFSDFEDIVVDLVSDISLDEGVGGGAGAGVEGVVMGDVPHLEHPIRVQVRSVLDIHHLAMAA